ncbi:hypothetical protein [Nonomuraea gerenzanensis]|uniref:Uncharacterized protein n=1 Tax=Nonomuraea gerenzanensis TaxID=93944 RepID=A0A1M4DWY0_9ACTN|nr:hypothetical protein [Nonomuraea gerenzanensis]UBU13395.1 hypothetical protein LCN96_55755 [Nonomuraea gerenzanensis]SBO91055.1 hypothetical protein BN4615_P569 [Nonomuraea gerenzanensis]
MIRTGLLKKIAIVLAAGLIALGLGAATASAASAASAASVAGDIGLPGGSGEISDHPQP